MRTHLPHALAHARLSTRAHTDTRMHIRAGVCIAAATAAQAPAPAQAQAAAAAAASSSKQQQQQQQQQQQHKHQHQHQAIEPGLVPAEAAAWR